MPKLKGQKIVRITTINSMYAQGHIELEDDQKNIYRMKVAEFLKIINDLTFSVSMKRKYNHLAIDQ